MRHLSVERVYYAVLVAGATLVAACSNATSADGGSLRVMVDPTEFDVTVGSTTPPLRAVVRNASGAVVTNPPLFWTSTDTTVATVSNDGVVTGRKLGVARVVASVPGGDAVATARVVAPSIASVSVSPAGATLVVGAIQQFAASVKDAAGAVRSDRAVVWTSDNEAVAAVSPFTGVVTARAAGAAKITAAVDGKAGSATITVTAAPPAPPPAPTPTVGFVFACTNFVCTFTDASTIPDGTGETWAWDFGDGQSSPYRNPDNRYAAPGTYTVTLTVIDNKGRKSSAQRSVSVAAAAPGTRSGVRLVNRASGRCLSVEAGSSDRGALFTTRACDGGSDQLYTLPVGEAAGAIQLNAFVDRFMEYVAIQDRLQLWFWNGSQYQRWTYTPSGQLRNHDTNTCVRGSAPVTMTPCRAEADQQWDVRQ